MLKLSQTSSEVVSIVFSLGTLVLTYYIAKSLFSRRVAALSMFFLAVMPASTVVDTWIKQDTLANFFAVLMVLLFLRKRYLLSGLVLGVGLFTKEIAIFALAGVFVFALFTYDRERVKGAVITGVIGGLMSFWWYLFISTGAGKFWDFFLGTGREAVSFSKPWNYYIGGLPTDIGWLLTVLMAIGLVYCLFRWLNGNDKYLLPAAWLVVIYVVISISSGKPFWMVSSALPAAAMLAAIGTFATVDKMTRFLRSRQKLRTTIKVVLLSAVVIVTAVQGIATGYNGYWKARLPGYLKISQTGLSDASFLNSNRRGELVFAVNIGNDRDAPVAYYLGDDSYYPLSERIVEAPQVLLDGAKKAGSHWVYMDFRFPTKADLTEEFKAKERTFIDQLVQQSGGQIVRVTPYSATIRLGDPAPSR